ncbi:hypothetical protein BDN72DRAFT_904730 [Pluteus cervinus]|uniref:Uncharacterized protein n=1 Tax=Pluteus cervinus TaxID=181527 RepID=A0ACD3A5C0_9AGAR|nr:hypothetical protein BDN72DRAFT_904730 [Pluteus cervinus]
MVMVLSVISTIPPVAIPSGGAVAESIDWKSFSGYLESVNHGRRLLQKHGLGEYSTNSASSSTFPPRPPSANLCTFLHYLPLLLQALHVLRHSSIFQPLDAKGFVYPGQRTAAKGLECSAHSSSCQPNAQLQHDTHDPPQEAPPAVLLRLTRVAFDCSKARLYLHPLSSSHLPASFHPIAISHSNFLPLFDVDERDITNDDGSHTFISVSCSLLPLTLLIVVSVSRTSTTFTTPPLTMQNSSYNG